MNRKRIHLSGLRTHSSFCGLLLVCATIAGVSGCGAKSKPINVTVTAAATTVDGADSTTLTAVLTHDKTGAGVKWSVTGGGTLSNQTKTSATYTAPAATTSKVTATVTATSISQSKESGTVTITVPAMPTLTTTNENLAGKVGTAYSVQLQGSGGIPPYVNWALVTSGAGLAPETPGGVLPPCVTLSTGGLLSSTNPPPASCAGTYSNLVFTFSDSGTPTPLTATTAPMTITITAAPAITFPAPSSSVPGPAVLGQAYSGSVAATGGAGSLTYKLNGSLPGGLSLNQSSGAITGTPTAAGTFPFTVTAGDAFGDAATSSSYSVAVNYPALAISPAGGSLPAGSVGVAYGSQTLTASGGSGSGYTWNISGLPADGLDYTATGGTVTISGKPTTAQTVTFTASVEDGASNTEGPYTYTIVVASSSGNNSRLQGTYACILRGFADSSGARTATLTSFQADGNGNLTGGVFDSNDRSSGVNSGTLTGTYNLGANGNGTASVDTYWMVAGEQNMNTVSWAVSTANAATPASQFSLVENDDVGGRASGRHAMGNCYLTTPSAFAASTLAGSGFVFQNDGEDDTGTVFANVGRVVFGASGMTVTSGFTEQAAAGSSTVAQKTITGGSFTAPDSATGRTQLTLDLSASGSSGTADLVVYLIDANRALALQTDSKPYVGEVRKQQQSTYSGANLNGALVFYTQALEFTTAGSTSPTGYYSIIYQGSGNGAGHMTIAQSYMSENGTYSAGGTSGTVTVVFDSTVPGRATISVNSGTIILYFFDTNSAFEMSLGGGQNPVESGRMEAQTQTTFTDAALAGAYMMTEMVPLEANALDQNGEIVFGSDGTVQGSLNVGGQGVYHFGQSLIATYAWDTTATGTGTFLAPDPAGWSCAVVTSTRLICVDQTAQPPAMRIFQQ